MSKEKEKIKLVPELRFPEFDEAEKWNKTYLGELLEFKNGINASKEHYGKGIKFINVLDIIQNQFITYDKIIGSVDISEKEISKNEVSYGDILFQRSSETREDAGQANVYLDKEKTAVFGGFVIRGKKKMDYNPVFMNYLLKTEFPRKEITSKSAGSTRFNIGQDSLNEVVIILPKLAEQQKIAATLASLDHLIAAENEKLEALQDHKKGLLQQLFPAKGEKVPKVRFGKFNDEWELGYLGNHCSITTGRLDANAMVENGEYRFYTCAKNFYFIDNYAFDTEALLISGNGANVGYIHYYNGKFNAYQRTYVLDSFDINISYVKYYLQFNLSKRIFSEKKEGNTPYIVKSTLGEMKILFPKNKQEQEKIAVTLTSLDDLITRQSKKIKALKEHKKGLMQGMFPKINN